MPPMPANPTAPHRRARASLATTAAALCALLLAGCGSGGSGGKDGSGHAADGAKAQVSVPSSAITPAADGAVPLPAPFAKPRLDLTDDQGHPYDLAKATADKPTLLYFGYTHCPDVCPTTMADIAVALTKVPAADRKQLQVVFVSTDPTRDTPARLRSWLASFNSSFTGLTGDFTTIQQAARTLGIAIAKPVKQPDGSYLVTHGAEVLAFSATDDKAHELFPAGTSAQQYTQAITDLVAGHAS